MYILFAFLSLLGYIFVDILFAGFGRKIGGFSSSFYRSGCLLITMLPILWILPTDLSQISGPILLQFLAVGFAGALGIIFHLESYKYLPVGIAGAIVKISTLIIILLSYIVYKETLDFTSSLGALIILSSVVALSLIKNDHHHLHKNHLLGVILSILAATTGAFWFFFVSYFGRELTLGTAAYFGEAMIFVALILLLPVHKLISGNYLHPITKIDLGKIFIYSTSALLGTGALVYATKIGNIGIVSLIGSSLPVFVSIIGYFFFKEKLSKLQFFLIFTTFIGLAILSF